VVSPHTEIKEIIDKYKIMEKDEVVKIFKLSYYMITQYDDATLNKHYLQNNKTYISWCEDAVIFYIARYRLFEINLFLLFLFLMI
jgi:hypothetical protein